MSRLTESTGTYAEALHSALAAIDAFESAGIRVPQHGRLRDYAKQFEAATRVAQGQEPRDVKLDHLHRGIWDVSDFDLIAEQLAVHPLPKGFSYAVSRAMKGGKVLRDEKRHKSARDFQFELVIGALFKRGGYEVWFEEPDIFVKTDFGEVVITAKRPRSPDNLKHLLEDADDQINRSGRPGLIAVDISFLIMPNDLHVPASAGAFSLLKRAIDAFSIDLHHKGPLILRSPATIGYITYGVMLVVDYEKPQLEVPRGCVFGRFIPVEDVRMRILHEMRARITCAV